VERFKGGWARVVMTCVPDGHRLYVEVKEQINQCIRDNRKIIIDEIASEMYVMERRVQERLKVKRKKKYS
jgi:hypothetical protein